jgi:ketosteroid isomerase-like protein
MRVYPALGVVALVALLLALTRPGGGMSAAETEIRQKRERFNSALVARDTGALAAIWTDDVRVTTSAGARIDGRDAYRERFAGYFANRREYMYHRQPLRIDVYEPWNVAAEHGRWRARWTDTDGPIDVEGEYLIHWRREPDGWFVHSEMFATPLRCQGGHYCSAAP